MITTRQYFKAYVLCELHLLALRGPYANENDTDAWRYVRDFDNTPDYNTDDEANKRMIRQI